MSDKEPLLNIANRRSVDEQVDNKKETLFSNISDWYHSLRGKKEDGNYIELQNQDESGHKDEPADFIRLFRFSKRSDFIAFFIVLCGTLVHVVCYIADLILFGRITGLFAKKSYDHSCDGLYVNSTTPIPTNPLYTSATNVNASNNTSFGMYNDSGASELLVFVSFKVLFHDKVMTIVYWYFVIGAIGFVATTVEYYLWEITVKKQTFRMRMALLRSLIQRKISYIDAKLSIELNSQIFDAATKVEKGISYELIMLLAMNLTMFSALIGSLVINWKLALVMLCLLPLVIGGSIVFSKLMARETIRELTTYSKAERIVQEVFSSIRTVFSLNGSKFEQKRYERELAPTRLCSIRKTTAFGVSLAWTQLLSYVAYAVGFIVGSLFKSSEHSGIVKVDDILIVTSMFANCLSFFNFVGPALHSVSEARGAAAPMFRLIDEENDTNVNEQGLLMNTKQTDYDMNGDIQFDSVDFEYPSRHGAKVLRGLSLVAHAGKTTALVGSSGCGKSTCISLILRYYEPSAGRITIAGRSLSDWNLKQFRQRIGVVSQEPVLFATTIYENIRFGNLDATRTEIEQAAREANAHHFIMKLPNKYESLVGERGVQLSGGEKQRIALARALIKQPTILLLDEATSALDNVNEKLVQEALDRACKGRTTIVIAHRLTTIQNADYIYVLDNGSVIEEGQHSTLVAKQNGTYQAMVKRQQMKKFDDDTSETLSTEQAMEKDEKQALERARIFSDGQSVELESTSVKSTQHRFPMLRLLALNKPEWIILLVACIASIICGASRGAFAILLAKMIEGFKYCSASDRRRSVLTSSFLCLGLGIVFFVVRCLQSTAFGISGSRLVERLRKKYFQCLLRQEIAYFDQPENNSGIITTRLSTGASSIDQMVNVRLGTACEIVALLTFGVVFGFVISWQIALIVLAVVSIMLVVTIAYTYYQVWLNHRLNENMELASSFAAQVIQNMRTVKQLSIESEFLRQYSDILHKRYQLYKKFDMLNAITYAAYVGMTSLAAAFVYWCALTLLEKGEIMTSEIIKIITFAVFSLQVLRFIFVLTDKSGAFISATETFFDLFDRKPAIDSDSTEGQELTDCRGEIEFNNVKFAYPTRLASLVLNRFQLHIKPGQHVALVGPSGCGKSTVIQLLERFYDVTGGQLLIDGTDIRKFNVRSLRSQFGLVIQEPILFDLTIAENITYGLENIPMEDVMSAARRANIHEFIEHLPQGYETKVGLRGSFLSGGEKQRIAIARVLIRRPKMLLLDEATSAMDSLNEQIVQATLEQAQMEDFSRTSLTVAHRLSTIRSSDLICVVDGGRITESGTHIELVQRRGAYYIMLDRNGT